MKIITASSSLKNTDDSIKEIVLDIKKNIEEPKLLLVYYTQNQSVVKIKKQLKIDFPNANILGCSSCQGIMTDKGYHSGHTLSVWAAEDEGGAYGTAVCEIKEKDIDAIFQQAIDVIRSAMNNSGRPGELPALIALHSTPGYEEIILDAIQRELGSSVPIIGGSAADDQVRGKWSVFDENIMTSHGIGIAVFFPTARVSYSFHSGYASTGKTAIATRVDGRQLLELDYQPAATVYKKWFKSETGYQIEETDFFAKSTLFPLGRQAGKIHDIPYYTLSHPMSITKENGIQLFCNILKGEQVHFMSGTKERLVSRAGRVVDSANEHSQNSNIPIGGIAIYCAGCMLHVKDELNNVAENVSTSMHHAPFICPFTFGEQGQFLGGEIAHGNLMISAILFHLD